MKKKIIALLLSAISVCSVAAGCKKKTVEEPAEQTKGKYRYTEGVHDFTAPETDEYMVKGGRCSSAAALGANLLNLKPCIEVKNGSMGVSKKYRGKYSEVLKTYAAERLADLDNIVTDHVFVTHAGCDDEIVDSVVSIVKETLNPKELHVTRAGATVSVHCGRNTLGLLYIRKSPLQ